MNYPRKLNFRNPISWVHHRHGWKWVVNQLCDNLHSNEGTLISTFVEEIENVYYEDIKNEPWVGFFHSVPTTPEYHVWLYGRHSSLDFLFKSVDPPWERYKSRCQGLFTLCEYNKQYLQTVTSVPVKSFIYPTPFSDKVFDFDGFRHKHPRELLAIGSFLRKWSDIYNLKTSYIKSVLTGAEVEYWKIGSLCSYPEDGVRYLGRVSDDEYDDLFVRNVIFLPFHDCAASTTLVECIVRNTPVLINNVGGVSEYLGTDYPLYYKDLDEAATKLDDLGIIEQAHKYLVNMDKEKFKIEYFLNDFINSPIYQAL